MTKDSVRVQLLQAVRDRQRADENIAEALEQARELGITWDELGEALGVDGAEARRWLGADL